jgi:mannose-1-phosphate guanylyltransferase
MKTVLLAAGFGTRLRPLTDTIPKCLVPINGKPLLQIWLEWLNDSGFEYFLINTHYLSKEVNDFVNNSKFKDKCVLKNEVVLLGTAGTLLSNLDFIGDEECLLVHADNYCLADFKDFIRAHNERPSCCLMTMMTFRTDNPSSCGIVEVDERNVVIGFHEKVDFPPGNLANGAIYILSATLINIFQKEYSTVSDFSTEILPHFIGKIFSYETRELFMDIGTPDSYKKANHLL